MAKDCPEDKILNPKTNRCIKANGITAKKLEPKSKIKKCPEGKVLNPKTNRCIKIKEVKEKKPRGRPKKELIIDIEPKEEKRTEEERLLIKLLPAVPLSYYYDVNKILQELKDTNYATDYKLDKVKEIINDLNDIYTDILERKNDAKTKKKDYDKFINYNNDRLTKAKTYYDELLIKFKKIRQVGTGINGNDNNSHIIQSVIVDKNIYPLPEAIVYILKNNYKANKIDETDNYYRFRQIEPSKLKTYNYKTIDKTKGIKEVIAYH
jgi:hypothetical protein